MKITIECETVAELYALIEYRDYERDKLLARVAELEREPLRFSLPSLARQVTDSIGSLTPGQAEEIRELINKGV